MPQENLPILVPPERRPPGGGQSAFRLPLGQGAVKVSAQGAVDIVFVIDTTGSMSDKINGLLATSQTFVGRIAEKNVDWRIAIVAFGDLTVRGDKIEATAFSASVGTVRAWLQKIPRNSGGGNIGESCLEALEKAMQLQGRPNAIRVFILMTDEPALEINTTVSAVIGRLRERAIITFVISDPIDYYKEMARETGGEWFQVSSSTDFLSILDRFSRKVAEVIQAVQLEAGGDVRKYLQLKSGRGDGDRK